MKPPISFLLAVCFTGLSQAGTALATSPLIMDQFTADPTAAVFDGQMYVYPSHVIVSVPGKGRTGWFCMEDQSERIEYATGRSPLGPFTPAGVIMDESTSGCWTNQQSIVEYQGQWYLFYHDKDFSPDFDKARSVRADCLFFNDDGTIKKVVPTLREVGRVEAKSEIQIDRYSAISSEGIAVSYLDPANTPEGWKISLAGETSWVRFNGVDFGKGGLKRVDLRAVSATGGAIEIRLDKEEGPLLGRVKIRKGSEWKVISSTVRNVPAGAHDLVVAQTGNNHVERDWISFE